jgi:hypothetical protein
MSQSSSVAVGRLASTTAALNPSVRASATARTSLEPAEILSRMVIVAMFTILAVRLGMDFAATRRFTGLLLLASEALVVVLTVFRRPTGAVDRSTRARLLTAASLVGPMLVRPAANAVFAGEAVTVSLAAIGLLIVIAGKISLGRSFGLMPANRGVVSSGLYRLVRHPIYLGYLITHVGFVLANGTFGNIAIFLGADVTLMIRAVYEERVLARDAAYRDYQSRVRWRVLPGIF